MKPGRNPWSFFMQNLVFCTAEDLKHIDRDLCIRNYQKFKRLHDQEVERLRKENKKALRWYIA